MPADSISVVPVGKKVCKPFLLEVMVFSPESGYKFEVMVELSCSPAADEIWKLVFDLYKVADGEDTQLVHVSYTTETAVESAAVQGMMDEGLKQPQAAALVNDVHPAAKAVAGKKKVTTADKNRVKAAMRKVVNIT